MATQNIVSQPPLTIPITDDKGNLTKPWSIWFRDLYRRTSFKGGNSIDENQAITDQNSSDIEDNSESISNNSNQISSNTSSITQNEDDISVNRDNIDAVNSLFLNAILSTIQLKVDDLEQLISSVPALANNLSIKGPTNSVDNTVPRFDGVTGKAIQGSSVKIDDSDNINMPTGAKLQSNGNDVVSSRQTGWAATTGTEIRTNFGDASLSDTSQALRALIVDLKAHGLIGT